MRKEIFSCFILLASISAFAKTENKQPPSIYELAPYIAEQSMKKPADKPFIELVRAGLKFESDRKAMADFLDRKAPLTRIFRLSSKYGAIFLDSGNIHQTMIEFGAAPNTILVNRAKISVDFSQPLLPQLTQILANADKSNALMSWAIAPAHAAETFVPVEMTQETSHLFAVILAASTIYSPNILPAAPNLTAFQNLKKEYLPWNQFSGSSTPVRVPCSIDGENKHSFEYSRGLPGKKEKIKAIITSQRTAEGRESFTVKRSDGKQEILASGVIELGTDAKSSSSATQLIYGDTYTQCLETPNRLAQITKCVQAEDSGNSCAYEKGRWIKEQSPTDAGTSYCSRLSYGCAYKLCNILPKVVSLSSNLPASIQNDLDSARKLGPADIAKLQSRMLAILAKYPQVKIDKDQAIDLEKILSANPNTFSGAHISELKKLNRELNEAKAKPFEWDGDAGLALARGDSEISNRAYELFGLRACCGSSACKAAFFEKKHVDLVPDSSQVPAE